MKNLIVSLFAFTLFVFGVIHDANAGSPTASGIFNVLSNGDTRITAATAISTQARTIYSLGGGTIAFKTKRISLFSADPPGFKAGCTGISWHFGGFAFISMDEIRQMVEAVAQASLGIVIDMAMHTLCPQCYAVMNKLRDIINMMRNAAADACSIAKRAAESLFGTGSSDPNDIQSDCSKYGSETGEADSWFSGAAGLFCRGMDEAVKQYNKAADVVTGWMKGSGLTNDKAGTPSKEDLQKYGNITYRALTALGYQDGFVKDFLLSFTGMTIAHPVASTDCRNALKNIKAVKDQEDLYEWLRAPQGPGMELITGSNSGNNSIVKVRATEVSNLTNLFPKDSTRAAGLKVYGVDYINPQPGNTVKKTDDGTDKSPQLCHAPPTVQGMAKLGEIIMCGVDPKKDFDAFKTAHNYTQAALAETALGVACGLNAGSPGIVGGVDKTAANPWIYQCRGDPTKNNPAPDCPEPGMVPLSEAMEIASTSGNKYTGLLWMIADALLNGVKAVREGTDLPPQTVSILNGSGYPLYRIMNIAAVYPQMASDVITSYAGLIAAQYALDTLDTVARIGAQPTISLKAGSALFPEHLSEVREQITTMHIHAEALEKKLYERLNKRQALVALILQINKSVQAEVISQGLGGNSDLAVSIAKRITASVPNPAPNQAP